MGLIRINDNKIIDKCYYGSKTINSIYYGNDLIYEKFSGLCFTSKQEGSTISIVKQGSPKATFLYSYDHSHWESYSLGTILTLSLNQKVYFKGNKINEFSATDYYQFSITGNLQASGILASLFHMNNIGTNIIEKCEYYKLFENCTGLTSVAYLQLFSSSVKDATINSDGCAGMFHNCSNLTNAQYIITYGVKLVKNFGYQACSSMFSDCSSLNLIPSGIQISANSYSSYCFHKMFYSCTSLGGSTTITISILGDSNNSISSSACDQMFYGCSNLSKIKLYLGATTLGNSSYSSMFNNCSKLQTITSAKSSSTRTFPSDPITTAARCCSGMFANTMLNQPVDPTMTLYGTVEKSAFSSMYYNCTRMASNPYAMPTKFTFIRKDNQSNVYIRNYAFASFCPITISSSKTNDHYYEYKLAAEQVNFLYFQTDNFSFQDIFILDGINTFDPQATYYCSKKIKIGG